MTAMRNTVTAAGVAARQDLIQDKQLPNTSRGTAVGGSDNSAGLRPMHPAVTGSAVVGTIKREKNDATNVAKKRKQ